MSVTGISIKAIFPTVRGWVFLGALAVALLAVGPRALAQEAPPDNDGGFVDIEGNIHEEDIRYIVERGLTVGCDLNGPRYCPADPVTRAEMATFLTRALDLDTAPYRGVYADVERGAWYTPFVEAMGSSGLTDTQVSESFRPDEAMLRSEMAIFLRKAFGLSSSKDGSASSFQDIPADARYAGAAEAILEAGITLGCGVNPLRYCPDDTVKRDTMASFLARALRAADRQRLLDFAPGRETLESISLGRRTWNVWVCENTPIQEDLVDYLNREITPYYYWLSGGKYRPQFRYGTDPSPEITETLENCENERFTYRTPPSGSNVFVGLDLWHVDLRVSASGALRVNHRTESLTQGVWMDKRAVYLTGGYAHEMGHAFGWPHNLKEAGDPASQPLITRMDIMATPGALLGTNAHNLFHVGWIDLEKVALHSEGTATYTLVPPHSKQGTELLMLPLGPDRLISVGARVQRGYDREIRAEGVELYEITLCNWYPGCKGVFLPPGATSIDPVVLDVGDSWTASIPTVINGREIQTDIRVSVTDRQNRSFTVKAEQTTPKEEVPVLKEDGFSGIDVGLPGVCGVRLNGTVDCWGWGGASAVPEGTFTTLGLGTYVCAIRATNASLECWGPSWDGTPPPEGEYASVSVTAHHACGLRRVGTAVCWGSYGDSEPIVRPPAGEFVSVSAGAHHACGIRDDQTVQCWGRTPDGADLAPPPTGEFTSVSSGAGFSCGLRSDNTVFCWTFREGYGWWQPPSGQYAFVAAGWNDACAIRADGSVTCWGHASQVDFAPPDGIFTTISVGYRQACGLRLDNTVECWGSP